MAGGLSLVGSYGVLIGSDTWFVKPLCGDTGAFDSDKENHALKFDVWKRASSGPDHRAAYGSIADAYAAFVARAPTTFGTLPLTDFNYAEDDEGSYHFVFTGNYTWKPAESVLRWSFDTSGGTIRLMTSKLTNAYAPSGRVAPNFGGAIGVKNTGKDAEPEGVDIVLPGLKMTATYKWPKDTVDVAYAKLLAGLTGKTNNAPFCGFATGELLFLGGTGEVVPGVPNEVRYDFLASENVTGLTIGSISAIAKKGHEYLWVAFEADQDTSAKKLVQKPLAVYVERVYDPADFTTMGFGP